MRKLAVATTAAAILVAAPPAYAIHDPHVPAGECAAPNSQAVGHPATGKANTAFSNTVLAEHNNADAQCT
jgi:hypothetical protein